MTSWAEEQRENHVRAIANMQRIRDDTIEAEANVRKNLAWWDSLSTEEIEELEKAAKAEEAQDEPI